MEDSEGWIFTCEYKYQASRIEYISMHVFIMVWQKM